MPFDRLLIDLGIIQATDDTAIGITPESLVFKGHSTKPNPLKKELLNASRTVLPL